MAQTQMSARSGGEEFAVVMTITGLEEAVQIAERIRQTIQFYSFGDKKFLTIVSIGIAMYPSNADSSSKLIEKSDSALYKAKHSGKNRVVAYSKPNIE